MDLEFNDGTSQYGCYGFTNEVVWTSTSVTFTTGSESLATLTD
jgi:hypothetical protein